MKCYTLYQFIKYIPVVVNINTSLVRRVQRSAFIKSHLNIEHQTQAIAF